jgi:hypothetical protein
MKKELILAAMGISSLTPGCMPSGTEDPMPPDWLPTGQVASKKIDVDRLLKRVADTPAPKELNPGAMCYSMMVPPDRAEYVCPSCGTKTIHALNQLELGWGAPALSVKHYRTYVEQLNKLGLVAKLDESFLCSACNKDGKTSLFLEVTVKGRVVRNALVDMNDLRKLIAFVQGDLVWKGEQDMERPLKPELPRIRQLLGVKE